MDADYLTAAALAEALRRRQLSAVEALEHAIARIELRDGPINAIVVRDFERARASAAAADAALARGERRPLLGVPITVKEAFNVAGLRTTWGYPGVAAPVQEDAVAVARLKASGAVILGKTNVAHGLMDWECSNPVYGRTCNPWDPARTPGGSSGGSAAALAAGLVPLELGSDALGSLRVPAHCCGVFAHKPSHGLIPKRGHQPPGSPQLTVGMDVEMSVVGPLARCTADLALALDILAGPDDPQRAYSLSLPPPRGTSLRDFKVLVLEHHPLLPLSAGVGRALRRFADSLQRAGCAIEHSSPLLPDLAAVAELSSWLLFATFGAIISAAEYDHRRQLAAAAGGEDFETLRLQAQVASHRDWVQAQRRTRALSHQWSQLFDVWDVVVCPVLPMVAYEHIDCNAEPLRLDIDGRLVPYGLHAAWTGAASMSGLPATAMPIGLGESGLPIGVQIIGPLLEDRTPLAFAELAERESGGFRPPPGYAT